MVPTLDQNTVILLEPTCVWVNDRRFSTVAEAFASMDEMAALYDLREEAHGRTEA